MTKVLVLFNKPSDPEKFNAYYTGTHIPLAKTIPGLKKVLTSRGPVVTPQGESKYHLITTLVFDSIEALQAGMGSPEGKKAHTDTTNFADGGAEILIFNDQEV